MDRAELERKLAWLERGAVALLLLAALVPRTRDIGATFDRELEGFQGACFAAFAVNYERLGFGEFGGYPTFNVDLPSGDATPYLYPNHPPLVPFVAWQSAKWLGPDGWEDAHAAGEPPEGIEPALRLPFFLAHVLSLFALWWAVRQTGRVRLALLSLAVMAFLPISILYAGLVNYENVVLVPILFGLGFHVRWLRTGARRELVRTALLFGLAGCVTYTPLFFLPALALQAWRRRGLRPAALEVLACGAAALVPLLAHGAWSKHAAPSAAGESALARAVDLVRPMFDGSAPLPEWVWRQLVRTAHFASEPVLVVALVGLVVVLVRARRERDAAPQLGGVLLGGGVLLLLAFYRHAWDGEGARGGQTVLLINLAPALAVLAAVALDALAERLASWKAGVAPLVVATSLVGLPALLRADAIRRDWRAPGPRDDAALTSGPSNPLPHTAGREVAALVPAGAIGLYPSSLGWTPAVSYYAWRTLFPIHADAASEAGIQISSAGLAGRRAVYFLIPRDASVGDRAQVDALRAQLPAFGVVERTTDGWELWRIGA